METLTAKTEAKPKAAPRSEPSAPVSGEQESEQRAISGMPLFLQGLGTGVAFDGGYPLQPKLAIGAPEDLYEQEADRVAEQVMSPASVTQRPLSTLQRKEMTRTEPAVAPPLIRHVLGHAGTPLALNARRAMESRLGQDFSQVQVHTGSEAEASAQSVGALAYTVGSHIVFGPQQYAPGTAGGDRLLAHELTHVAQQTGGQPVLQRKIPPGKGVDVGDSDQPALSRTCLLARPTSRAKKKTRWPTCRTGTRN